MGVKSYFILAAGAFLLSGCAMKFSPKSPNPETGFYRTYDFNICAGEAARCEIKKAGEIIQTNPVEGGYVTTKIAGASRSIVGLRTGASYGLGYRKSESLNFRLKAGLDARFNLSDEGYLFMDVETAESALRAREEFERRRDEFWDADERERERLAYPERPDFYGSVVYTKVTPGQTALIPKAEIEAELGNLVLGFEFGLPYTRWEAESGQDMESHLLKFQGDKWGGFGKAFSWQVGWRRSHLETLFLKAFRETYEPNFAGEDAEIDSTGIVFGWQYNY